MNRLCPVVINCPGVDSPIMNLSSEAPDPFVFESVFYPPIPRPCLTCDPFQVYQSRGCYGIAFSAVSQDQADLLARLSMAICKEPGSQQFSNDAQTATVVCPAGSVFSYTVPAGSITVATDPDPDAWLAASNAAALAYAQEQASSLEQRCCVVTTNLRPHPAWMCVGQALTDDATDEYEITGLNSAGVWDFTIIAGALPPGITIVPTGNNTAELIGAPTIPGNYSFTIQAIRPALPFVAVTVNDALDVFGITNPHLSDGDVGVAYSEQLLTAGGTMPVTFGADPADLPAGLVMDPTGLITGTPTTPGVIGFEVTIIDAEGKVCDQTVSIEITSGCVPDVGPAVPDTWSNPQPARIRIQAFDPGMFGSCAPCAAAAFPVWDGTLPVQRTSGNFALQYYSAGTVFPLTNPQWDISGVGTLGTTNGLVLGFFGVAHNYWQLTITCADGQKIWEGQKTVGLDPIGKYIRLGTFQYAAGPACLSIESY